MNIPKVNIANLVTKGIGAAGLGLVLYDSHTLGKIQSASTQADAKATSLANSYAGTMSLDTPSIVKSNIKQGLFNLKLDENITGFFTGIGGYLKGFGSMLVSNVVPLALSVGTVATHGKWSKGFGIGLLAYGGIFICQEFFGIAKPNKLTNNF